MSRAALAMQSAGWGGSAAAVPSDLDATTIGRGGARGRVGGADRESVHVGRVYGRANVVVVVGELCLFSEGSRAVAGAVRRFFGSGGGVY